MDCLTDKASKVYNYSSRYSTFPYYYNKNDDKYMYGTTGQLDNTSAYVLHTIRDTDTLDSLALEYYGRPDLFWAIADFNRIQDSFIKLYGNYTELRIPDISSIGFIKK